MVTKLKGIIKDLVKSWKGHPYNPFQIYQMCAGLKNFGAFSKTTFPNVYTKNLAVTISQSTIPSQNINRFLQIRVF